MDTLNLDWDSYIASDDYGGKTNKRLHLGLYPQPYIGDVTNASIYILLLNPGLGPIDYYSETGENGSENFRAALRNNLKQNFEDNEYPFMFLDPQFSWHSGYTWWHERLAKICLENE